MKTRGIQMRVNPNREAGSFIIEAMISLLIFAVALIGLVGLATQSLSQLGQTKSRNDASYLASELVGDMWITATPSTYDLAAWAGSDRVVAVLSRIGSGVVAVSGTEVTASSDGTEPCHGTTAITATQVFICVSWRDAKSGAARHFYRTATEVVKN
jgi:type IV pilus assembly protein PilV